MIIESKKERKIKMNFQFDDKITYIGRAYPYLNGRVGRIHSKVHNEPNKFVTEFENDKHELESFVMSGNSLAYAKVKPTAALPKIDITPVHVESVSVSIAESNSVPEIILRRPRKDKK
jgi:hypothetical protein